MNHALIKIFDLKNLNTPQLEARLIDHIGSEHPESLDRVQRAVTLAFKLHANDRRSNEPYINHPLRCANRLITYFGIKDVDVIIAALCHDVIEDHPDKLIAEVESVHGDTFRDQAVDALDQLFGSKVSSIVLSVSNPVLPKEMSKVEKHAIYADHVSAAISDVKVFFVKLADFNDNALGLHHTQNAEMVASLAKKYAPLYEIFRRQTVAFISSGAVDSEVGNVILKRLETSEQKNRRFVLLADSV